MVPTPPILKGCGGGGPAKPDEPPQSLYVYDHQTPGHDSLEPSPLRERAPEGNQGSQQESHQVSPLYKDKLRRPFSYSQHRLLLFP